MKRSRAAFGLSSSSLHAVAALGVTALGVAFSACSDGTPVVDTHGDAAIDDDAGKLPPVVGGATDAATDPDDFVPPGCAVNATPADNPCVIIEALGVFVSKSLGAATPSPNGTLGAPYASLQKGIDEAKRLKKRVYACAETYDEAITFENGVSIFGYFDCSKPAWTVIQPQLAADGGTDGGAGVSLRARIVSPTSPAARSTGIANDTVLESLDILAPDVVALAGASSIALIAQNSPRLVLSHVALHAGVAGKGKDGVDGVQLADSPATKDGAPGFSPYWCHTPPGSVQCAIDPSCIDPACVADHAVRPGGANACTGGQAAGPGGNGGAGGNWIKDATFCGFTYADPTLRHVSAGDARPANGSTALGGIQAAGCGSNAGAGANGASGTAGTDGTSASAGSLTADGFVPGDGTAGSSGSPGQGGGGGGGAIPGNPSSSYYVNGSDYWGSSGSGGGAGGCAGLAGTAGKGGGASIGIVLFDSPITLRNCSIEASNGGAGGAGTLGSNPTAPGSAGPAYGTDSIGTVGGAGGDGGRSGWSGGGAGGHSIGIATHGAAATLASTPTAIVGAAGAGAATLTGNGKTIPGGGAGAASPTLNF